MGKGYKHGAPHTTGHANPKDHDAHGYSDPQAGLGTGSPMKGQEGEQGALRGVAKGKGGKQS